MLSFNYSRNSVASKVLASGANLLNLAALSIPPASSASSSSLSAVVCSFRIFGLSSDDTGVLFKLSRYPSNDELVGGMHLGVLAVVAVPAKKEVERGVIDRQTMHVIATTFFVMVEK